MKFYFKLLALCFVFALNATAQNVVTPYAAITKRNAQSGADIYKALDNDLSTIYHTDWYANSIPDTVDLYFYAVKSINKLTYTPRPIGLNGVWRNVDLYYTTASNPTTFVKQGSYTWAANNTAKEINLSGLGIVQPLIIRYVVTNAEANFSSCAEFNFYSSETGSSLPNTNCDLSAFSMASFKDVLAPISSATASTFNSASEAITKSYDGDFNTLYHSQYSFVVSANNPAILTYNFNSAPTLDYIVYYPRTSNVNGNFGEIEVLYKQTGQSGYTSLLTYNANFSSSPSTIKFPSSLANVASIQLKVKSGANNFASCSEIQFFTKTTFDDSTTGLSLFVDDLYTGLKSTTTQAQIDNIASPYIKALANCMFAQTYNYRYRVQQYKPYGIVANLASRLKTSTYNSLENPTGLYFEQGKEVVLFVGPQADDFSISLKVTDMTNKDSFPTSTYVLKPGLNVIVPTTSGLGYINYYTDNASAQPITIHIPSGNINGAFDITKDSAMDWVNLVNGPNYISTMDLKGKYMNLLFDRNLLKKYNPLDIKPLIQVYDSIAKLQFNMMGLKKYNILPNNHMFAYGHFGGGLFAGGLGMHFDYTWGESNYVSVNGVLKGDIWGVAHEIGHINQVRPSFKWGGMTEVTNNIYSTYTEYTMSTSKYLNGRLERENVRPFEGDPTLDSALPSVVGGRYSGFLKKALMYNTNLMNQNVFGRVVPFWQLQLYYQFAGALRGAPTLEQRMSDAVAAPASGPDYAYWIGDVMQKQRARSDGSLTPSALMLNFVTDVCDVVQEDLTDFFTKVGMLKPIDTTYEDYSSYHYVLTQAQIDGTIAAIKAKNYTTPVSPVLHYLSANSLNAFKNKLLVQGVYGSGLTIANNQMVIAHSVWKNVAVFETYTVDNKLFSIDMVGTGSLDNTQTTISFPAAAEKVYAISYDGSKVLVYARTTQLPISLTNFNAELTNGGALITWTTSAEINNKTFEVFKSTDGVNFIKIGVKPGAGNSNDRNQYSLLDREFNTSSYYKLAQIDFDGKMVTFNDQVKFVKALTAEEGVKAFPNPTTSKVTVTSATNINTVNIIDITGKVIKKIAGQGTTLVIDLQGLPKGVYNLQIVTKVGVQLKKIVKQ